jgi:hypothetical protein
LTSLSFLNLSYFSAYFFRRNSIFSHNKSTNSIFQPTYQHSRTGSNGLCIPIGRRQLDTHSADNPSLMYIDNRGLCGPLFKRTVLVMTSLSMTDLLLGCGWCLVPCWSQDHSLGQAASLPEYSNWSARGRRRGEFRARARTAPALAETLLECGKLN